MQQRIVERPRQHRHRLDLQRVHQRVDLPEAEVAGEEQHAASCACAATTRSSPSNSTCASICSGRIVLNLSSTISSRPKCENIARAIARTRASERSGNAACRFSIASRRWPRSKV